MNCLKILSKISYIRRVSHDARQVKKKIIRFSLNTVTALISYSVILFA